MITAYTSDHKHSKTVCEAFAAGCGAPIGPPYPLRRGDVFLYGALRGLLITLQNAQREGRTWYYADNGYMRRGHYDGYYRVTRNALQHDGSGTASSDRWRSLGMTIEPWRTGGRHIVVCPPSRLFATLFGFNADHWLRDVVATIKANTDRPIRVRRKMSWTEVKAPMAPLQEDLQNAWALVTHSSNAAVEAAMAGVPVFATDQCGASRVALSDVTKIEKPIRPDDREEWLSVLAANQWTLDEMRSGLCWRMLQEHAQ